MRTVFGCFQWFKDTNLKANHNSFTSIRRNNLAVSNGSKILIWKQITTVSLWHRTCIRCFQWFKDTNLKANHNVKRGYYRTEKAVSNGSKILIWKQITTVVLSIPDLLSCFQWFKDTNLKANHNGFVFGYPAGYAVSNGSKILIWKQITTDKFYFQHYSKLFPMVQRY